VAEVGWREFAQHLIHHFPETPDRPLRKEFEKFPWQPRQSSCAPGRSAAPATRSSTPACVRFWQTGWQHNRVRMIAASVLVKHLLQPWNEGAEVVLGHPRRRRPRREHHGLAMGGRLRRRRRPYFRVFNPVLQGEKFDPDGDYVRRWVPELAKLPAEWIHQPWEAPMHVLAEAGIKLGKDYPAPLIGLTEGRDRALKALKGMRPEES
jgi:deoxyribodipyrimidine photo-lyase